MTTLPRLFDNVLDLSQVDQLTDTGLTTELATARTALRGLRRTSLAYHDAKLAVDVLDAAARIRGLAA